jgi:plasmid stabilization system protein ParE
MRLAFHPRVARDLSDIVAYYDEHSLNAGERFASEVDAAFDSILENPARHHFVDPTRRRCNLKNFPYHIIYETEKDVVHVLVVRHHRRRPDYGMRRKMQ